MAILKLVDASNHILKQKMEDFDFTNPPIDPIQLAKDLAETMIENKGPGLAANQVGLPYRVFVLTGSPINACFNPKVVDSTSEMVYLDEGCLSYPGLVVKIKRPKMLRVRFTMPNGETKTEKFDGMTARCFLHELDHLNGIVHLDRAHPYHKEKAKKARKAYEKILARTK